MIRTFRLTNEPDRFGLSCTAAGLSLAGVPLLRKTKAGFEPRPAAEIVALLAAAFGIDEDLTRLRSSLRVIADAFNRGDLVRASIAAVQSRTPELTWQAAARLANADLILRKDDADEPRDWHGRWTDSDEERFEQEYDDLHPVEFAKAVIQFGDRLGREGRNLPPDEREHALAVYSFLQDRLSFWLGYNYTPPEAQLNLHSAALTLYQGAVNSGLVGPRDLPPSMLDVAGAAWGADNAPANVRPTTAKPEFDNEPIEHPPSAPADAPPPKEVEGSGGVIDNREAEVGWNGGIGAQSGKWETRVATANPGAKATEPNATTFDLFNAQSGEAISAKTLNTLTVNYIKRPRQILSRLKGYINAAADYEQRRESDLDPTDIKSKTIQLAIPQYTSPAQWRYLDLAARYARERGVRLVVTRIRG